MSNVCTRGDWRAANTYLALCRGLVGVYVDVVDERRCGRRTSESGSREAIGLGRGIGMVAGEEWW